MTQCPEWQRNKKRRYKARKDRKRTPFQAEKGTARSNKLKLTEAKALFE